MAEDLFDIPKRDPARPTGGDLVQPNVSDNERARLAEQEEIRRVANDKPWAMDVLQNFENNSVSQGFIDYVNDEFVYDPQYLQDEAEWGRLTKDIPEEFHANFDSAVSREHADTIRSRMLMEVDNRKDLADMGVGEMIATELFTYGLDTPALVAEFMIPGVTRGRVGARFLQGAAANAAVGAAVEGAIVASSETESHKRTAIATGLGAIIGGPLGALLGQEAATVGRKVTKNLTDDTFGLGDNSAGSAAVGGKPDASLRASEDTALEDFNLADDAMGADVQGKNIRFTNSAQINRSELGIVKRAGHALVPDALGHQGGVVQSATVAEIADAAVDATLVRLNKINNGALREWLRETGQSTLGARYRPKNIAKFDDLVDQEVRGIDTGSPSVKKMAAAIREINEDLGQRGEKAGVLRHNKEFTLSRQFDDNKLRALIADTQGGTTQVEALIAKAFRLANNVDDAVAAKFARHYLRTIREKGAGLHPKLASASGDDLDIIDEILAEGGADAATMLEVRSALEASQADSKFTFAKGRSLLDETATVRVQTKSDGLAKEIGFRDILRTGGRSLTESHIRNVEGAIALSRKMNIKSPADINRLYDNIRSEAAGLDLPAELAESNIKNLNFTIDGIMGRANRDFGQNPDSLLTHAARTVRDFNFLRMGPRFGLASVPETAALVGQGSTRLLMERVPGLGAFIRGMRKGEPDALDLAREIEELNGLGQMRQTHVPGDRFEETQILGNLSTERLVGKGIDAAQGVTQGGRRLVAEWSGLSGITDVEQSVAASYELQRLFRLAKRNQPLGKRNKELMRELGMDEAMAQRVMAGLRKHKFRGKSADGKRMIDRIDHDAFERVDPDAYAALAAGTYRKARRLIQAQDLGVAVPQLQTPLFQMVTQFRTFAITAYEKQLLNGIYNMDAPRAITMMTSFGIALTAYTALTGLEHGGDPKELKKRMAMDKLVTAGINRMGAATLAPAAYDTIAPLFGMDPAFSHGRNSELASNFITGNPTVDLFDRAYRLAALPGQLVGDPARQLSQADVRDARRLAPFIGTVFGMNRVVESFTKDLPKQRRNPRIARREKARKERDSIFN
jgi:hypothetical protein